MGTITLPSLFVTGSPASADDIMENLYRPIAGNSLQVMNGRLNADNLDFTGTPSVIHSEAIRKGALSRGGMVGLTGNLDYPAEVFAENDDGDNAYTMIPGACQSFYMHHAGTVIFTWFLNIGTDKNTDDSKVSLQLFINDDLISGVIHELPISTEGSWTGLDTDNRHPDIGDRVWSGHYLNTNMGVGWHNAGIGIYSEANLSRVRVRHFGWVWFL